MKNFLLCSILVAFFCINPIISQVSTTFNGFTGNPFNSAACNFTDVDTSPHELANTPTGCGPAIVSAASAGGQIGFRSFFESNGTNGPDGFSDGDVFGVGSAAGAMTVVGAVADGNAFLMEDIDGIVRVEFSDVSLVGTTSPSVSIQYILDETGWETNDFLEILVNIKDCAGATTVELINTAGSDIDDLGIENSWNTLMADLTPYIGCISNVQIRHSSNSASEELGIDNLIYTQGVVPVTLLDFAASYESQVTQLSWTTASEINNDYFDVQRSTDMVNFETIGKVNGSGTTNNEVEYSFTDRNPVPGLNYYRLAQYDFNGDMEYHKVIAVKSRENGSKVYPSITQADLNVNISAPANLIIYNASGAKLMEKNFKEAGTIDVSDLENGIYILQINTDGAIENHRFIKQ